MKPTQLFCQQSATIHRDHPLFFHVALIPSQHHLCIIPRVGFYLGRPARNQKQRRQNYITFALRLFCHISYRKQILCHFFIGCDLLGNGKKGHDVKSAHHLVWSWTVIMSPFIWHHIISESLMAVGKSGSATALFWKYAVTIAAM